MDFKNFTIDPEQEDSKAFCVPETFTATTAWCDQSAATPIEDMRAIQKISQIDIGLLTRPIEDAFREWSERWITIHLPRIKHHHRRRRAKLRMLRLGRKRRKGCNA
jgi:hypothetical protein